MSREVVGDPVDDLVGRRPERVRVHVAEAGALVLADRIRVARPVRQTDSPTSDRIADTWPPRKMSATIDSTATATMIRRQPMTMPAALPAFAGRTIAVFANRSWSPIFCGWEAVVTSRITCHAKTASEAKAPQDRERTRSG